MKTLRSQFSALSLVGRAWVNGPWGLRAPALASVHPGETISLVSHPRRKPQDGWMQKASPCQLQDLVVVKGPGAGTGKGIGNSQDQS